MTFEYPKYVYNYPALDVDKAYMKQCRESKYGDKDWKLSDRHHQQRQSVFNAITFLGSKGWAIHSVFDSEDTFKVTTAKDAMEHIFAVDEVSLRFYKGDHPETVHGVHVILMNEGNLGDIFCDWSTSKNDADGFGNDMDALMHEAGEY